MLKNSYVKLSLYLIFLQVITLVVGRFLTITDWALILFLAFDKEIQRHSVVGFILILGFLNDYYSMTLFGVTPLLFLCLLLLRWLFVKNFDFDEIQRIRFLYYLSAIVLYSGLFLLFTGYREESMLINLLFHIVVNSIFLFIFKMLKEFKSAVSYT